MKFFFEDFVAQATKSGRLVCGDYCVCQRTPDCTTLVLCDGIGSGVYANVAAISCASRVLELLSSGLSQGRACAMVADSMHRARTEDIPFSAFSAARILQDGHFTVYTYEAPPPILIRSGFASVLKPHYHSAGSETVGESSGALQVGDSLVLCSDGATQAGTGRGHAFGIGPEGLADYINHLLGHGGSLKDLPPKVTEMSSKVSGGRHEDDTTVALLHCRCAREITVLSGPPSIRSKDRAFVERFFSSPGARVVCGSTTAEILSRELGREIRLKSAGASLAAPPEYEMDGVDMITEGAVVLNQIGNLLDENPERFSGDTPAQRVCSMLLSADVVTFLVGRSVNSAHAELFFKQLGIRPREAAIRLIAEKLRQMGKLVVVEYF